MKSNLRTGRGDSRYPYRGTVDIIADGLSLSDTDGDVAVVEAKGMSSWLLGALE